MDSVIYYFSATGNSLKVAKDIASQLDNTELMKICIDNLKSTKKNDYKKIGIIFPVYYFRLPIIVREFVESLDINKNSYVYGVATCGGFTGGAIEQLKGILNGKGISLSSAFTIVMPDNYQVMYSTPSLEKQHRLFEIEAEKVKNIAEKINRFEIVPIKDGNFVTRLFGNIVSSTFKPKNKDKNFWTDENCNGCGICSKVCPTNNITLVQNKPQWLHQCEHCLACMQWCPKYSIQYKKGTVKRGRYNHPEIDVSELFF